MDEITLNKENIPNKIKRIDTRNYCSILGRECNLIIDYKSEQVFFGLPFNEEYIDVRATVERTLKSFGLRPYFADEEIKEGLLFCKICERIRESRVVFFEVTEWNPNVAFEAGMAIGHQKHIFLLSRGRPFTNLEGVQRIQYKNLHDLEKEIKISFSQYQKDTESQFNEAIKRLASLLNISDTDPKFITLQNELKKYSQFSG